MITGWLAGAVRPGVLSSFSYSNGIEDLPCKKLATRCDTTVCVIASLEIIAYFAVKSRRYIFHDQPDNVSPPGLRVITYNTSHALYLTSDYSGPNTSHGSMSFYVRMHPLTIHVSVGFDT
jgi:hypothetical protein